MSSPRKRSRARLLVKRLFKTKPWSSVLFASAFAPICLGLLLGGVRQSTHQSPLKDQLRMVNKTESIEVVDARIDDYPSFLIIVLKNVGTVDINGFEIGLEDQTLINGDSSVGAWALSPGATYELALPAKYVFSEITILAAMFSDGSIEGDPTTVKRLKQWRSGLKKHLHDVLQLFERELKAPDVNSLTALDRINSQISSMSPESETDLDMASGARDAKSALSTELQILRQRLERNGTQNQHKRLLELKARIEKRMASL